MKGHLLIVGQNPGEMKTTDPRHVPIHKVLYRWCNAVGVKYYSFVNVQHSKGEWYPTLEEIEFLDGCVCLHEGPILVLGLKAWQTMHDLYGKDRRKAMKGPHPSGRNRAFNNDAFEERFLEVLKSYLEEKDHGVYGVRKVKF